MLSFKRISIEDKRELTEVLFNSPDRGCEYTFGNLYIWGGVYRTEYARTGGYYIIRHEDEDHAFLFPVEAQNSGDAGLKAAVDEMLLYCEAENKTFKIIAATKSDCDRLAVLYPDRFRFEVTRDYAEYVYNSNDLISLSGKKYHSKRNHLSRFINENSDWEFHEITRDNIDSVQAMNDSWYRENFDGNETLREDEAAAVAAFDSFFELGFKGGFVTAREKVIAFAMGEAINPDVFCVHLEKADYSFEGAYAIINREFSAHFCGEYKYINREDDMGDEGLRKAKLSYYPAQITEKYVVTLND